MLGSCCIQGQLTEGCIKASVQRVGGLDAILSVDNPFSVLVTAPPTFSAKAASVTTFIPTAVRTGGIKVTTSLVCTLDDYYLRVAPTTMWVSEEDIQQMLIESNTSWGIE